MAHEVARLSSKCLDVDGGPDSGVLGCGGRASSEDSDGGVHVGTSSTASNCASSARADDIAVLVDSLVDSLGNNRGVASGAGAGTTNSDSDGGGGVLALGDGDGRDSVDIGNGRDRDDFSDNGTRGEGGSATTVGIDSAGDGRVDSGGRSGTTDVLGSGGSRNGNSGDLAGNSGGGNSLTTVVGLDTDSRVEALKNSGVRDCAVVGASLAGNVEGSTNTLFRQGAEINTVGKSLGKTVVEGLALAQGRLDVEGGTDQERRARNREGNLGGRLEDSGVEGRADEALGGTVSGGNRSSGVSSRGAVVGARSAGSSAGDDSGEGRVIVNGLGSRIDGGVESADSIALSERGGSAVGVGGTSGQAVVEGLSGTLGEDEGEVNGDTGLGDVDLNQEENTVDGEESARSRGDSSARGGGGNTGRSAGGRASRTSRGRVAASTAGNTRASSAGSGVARAARRKSNTSRGGSAAGSCGSSAVEDFGGGRAGGSVLNKGEVGSRSGCLGGSVDAGVVQAGSSVLDECGANTVGVGRASAQARLDARSRLSLSGEAEKRTLVSCVGLDKVGNSSNSGLCTIGVGRNRCRRGGGSN